MVMVRPDERVFRGETVTLRCDIKWGGETEWTYRWEREGTDDQYKTQELNISSVDLVFFFRVCLLIIISVNSFSLYNFSCFVQLKLRQQCECLHSRG